MKQLFLIGAAAITPLVLCHPAMSNPVTQKAVYMGKASTGESVYYHGANAQCGDLPRNHECWKNPMISYTIGSDDVLAIPDCKRKIFREVSVGDQIVARNMKPQSEAIRRVLQAGCNSVR